MPKQWKLDSWSNSIYLFIIYNCAFRWRNLLPSIDKQKLPTVAYNYKFILHSLTQYFLPCSAPHLAGASIERIVPSRGVLLSPQFRIGFTGFNITRTSESPLISQLLISNVTTEINGSTIYCSEDGNENNAPMAVILNVINKGMIALWYIYYTFISEHAVNMVISDEANFAKFRLFSQCYFGESSLET